MRQGEEGQEDDRRSDREENPVVVRRSGMNAPVDLSKEEDMLP